MKKILTIMLCLGAMGSLYAQKALVDQAKKLSGKADKLTEARGLIKQAMENPETQNNAETFYVAGKIEFDAFDNAYKTKMINPNDPSAQGTVMADELLNGYNYFMQALPLDGLPNEKGQVKPRFSKDISGKIKGHANDFFSAGADYFNDKKYYPEAYNAFMIYGSLPENGFIESNAIDPSQIATAFFNAGLAAYSGDAVEESAAAFKKARLAGYDQPEAYIYEIACWQTIAQRDENRSKEAQDKIMDVAKDGNEKFGLEQPIFINNMINSMVSDGDIDGAIAELNEVIAANPDNANLYGLRGYVYDRADNNDMSEADYRKAASLPDVDFETLKNASKKLFRIGTQKLNDLEGNSPETAAARQDIKNNYFLEAQKIAEQAGTMNPNDSDLLNVLDSLEYAITTYFSN
ncbi:MAG: hypothetical protein J1E95_00870 [Muribaculaceae bacterium]|nr:hypothetical protein [Muribaculaceae bacterium]